MSIKNWYPFYPMDFLRDTEKLTLEERCLYRDMLDIYWINEGLICEKDAKKLAKRRDFSSQKFDKCWKKVSVFFPISKGKLTNDRMDQELEKAREKHEKAVLNGSAGGLAKASSKAKQEAEQKPTSSPSPSHIQPPIDSSPPFGGVIVYQADDEKTKSVFVRPMQWVTHFTNTYGYSLNEAQTEHTIPMFQTWCEAGVTIEDAQAAMQIATQRLGEYPGSPRYLDKIVRKHRGATDEQKRLGPIPAKPDNAALAARLKRELEAANDAR